MLEKLTQVVKLQDELNRKIDKDWLINRTERDFLIATFQEVSEFIDTKNWKWWKHQEEDEFNRKVELVDIFHFLLSYKMLENYKVNERLNYRDVANVLLSCYRRKRKRYGFLYSRDDIYLVFRIIKYLFNDEDDVLEALKHFFVLVDRYFKDLDEFIKWYYVKNILNEIRQIKGYKEGNYQKVLDNLEDNYYIYKLAEEVELTNFEEFKNILLDKYLHEVYAKYNSGGLKDVQIND